ncbi:galactose-1-phosphate uridylyltransferase [Thermococcus atlanticus]
MRELRYNPLTGQWVMVSAVRKKRPWRPEGYCPFCPGAEETGYGWDVLVLPNRYPVLDLSADNPENPEDKGFYKKARAVGKCGIIVETPEHNVEDLDELSLEQMKRVVEAWMRITEQSSKDKRIAYLMIFRNKGKEIGVSLTHPHGQFYALPFIPLKVRLKIDNSRKYYRNNGKCLFCRILEEELASNERIIYENQDYVLFMPFFANWPFESHIYPKRHVQFLTQLNRREIENLADVIRVTTATLNTLFGRQMPYIMGIFQAPFNERTEFYHLHIEFYPILRDASKIKYAAGIETTTWEFTYDGLPEENAERLREACRRTHLVKNGKCR